MECVRVVKFAFRFPVKSPPTHFMRWGVLFACLLRHILCGADLAGGDEESILVERHFRRLDEDIEIRRTPPFRVGLFRYFFEVYLQDCGGRTGNTVSLKYPSGLSARKKRLFRLFHTLGSFFQKTHEMFHAGWRVREGRVRI